MFPAQEAGVSPPPLVDASSDAHAYAEDDASIPIDAAGPVASFSSDGVDFGLADCDGDAPPDQSFTLANHGGAPLTWEATISASQVFSIHGKSKGTIAPGKSADIVVSVQALTSAENAGDTEEGLLTVATNDPAHSSRSLALIVTPAGGMLTMAPGDASFGQIGLSTQAPDIPITLTNTGNRSVDVSIGAPTDAAFALAWQGSPGVVTLAPGDSVADLVARFKPKTAAARSATASITAKGVMCGPALPALTLSGEGTNGAATVSPGSLSFGSIRCGKKANPKTLTVSNGGNQSFHFTAALAGGASSPYSLAPAAADVAPGTSATITVTPKAIPTTSATTSDLYADKLTITTNVVGDSPHVVKLHETALGARLSFTSASIGFGGVPSMTQASQSLAVKNAGNAAATVTLHTSGAPFGVTPTQASPVSENGGSLTASASFTPTATGHFTGTLWITTTDGLCAPLPASVTLSGDGTSGKVSLSSQTLDFGEVPCGTTAASQGIHLRNIGTAAFTWTAALTKTASPYAIDVKNGTVNAGQEAVITVTPKGIPQTSAMTAGLYDDVLTITTNVAGDAPHAVKLVESPLGAILTYPTSYAFGPIASGTTSTPWNFAITNAGNQPVTVSFTPAAGSPFAFGSGSISVGASAAASDSATYTAPASSGASSSESIPVSVVAGTPLCAPLPGSIALSASTP